jgi:hypothetical protein
MLQLRLASGLPLDLLDADGRRAAERAVADGLLEWRAAAEGSSQTTLSLSRVPGVCEAHDGSAKAGTAVAGTAMGVAGAGEGEVAPGGAGAAGARVVLTRRGRLLADAVVRDLLVPVPT